MRTEHVLGAELPQVFELHVDVDDGRAPGKCQNDDVTAQDFLEKRNDTAIEFRDGFVKKSAFPGVLQS